MSSDEDQARIAAARDQAHSLGYMLLVDEAPNMATPITHMAHAARDLGYERTSVGRFLTYSTSVADAAEAGLAILRGIVNNGDPWPEPS